MKTKIDLKSALIGFCLGIGVVLGIAAGSSTHTVGRYQIAGTTNYAVIIDTTTGQAWARYLDASVSHRDFFGPKTGGNKEVLER